LTKFTRRTAHSENLLRWYIKEQLEEEAAIMDILTNAREVMKTSGLYRVC
jgi:ferritin